MPNASTIKQILTSYVVPPLAGALATWVTSTQVLGVFHITRNTAAAAITQALVFGVISGLAWLSSHHILKGTYTAPVIS